MTILETEHPCFLIAGHFMYEKRFRDLLQIDMFMKISSGSSS